MKRLLVLRPEPGASATAAKARALGLEPIAIPLFKTEAVEWEAPEASAFDGLLLTSANAIRCGGELSRIMNCSFGGRDESRRPIRHWHS